MKNMPNSNPSHSIENTIKTHKVYFLIISFTNGFENSIITFVIQIVVMMLGGTKA